MRALGLIQESAKGNDGQFDTVDCTKWPGGVR